jgi:hypothetical protein
MQRSSRARSLFFDYNDITGNSVGLVAASVLFLVLTPATSATAA